MGRWERIVERIEAMDEDAREALLEELEELLDERASGASELTDEQAAEVARRLANPGRLLTTEETQARLARLRR